VQYVLPVEMLQKRSAALQHSIAGFGEMAAPRGFSKRQDTTPLRLKLDEFAAIADSVSEAILRSVYGSDGVKRRTKTPGNPTQDCHGGV